MWKTLPYQWLRVRSKHFCAQTLFLLLLFPVACLATGNTPADSTNLLSANNLPAKTHGQNLKQCLTKLNAQGAGWCEIYRNKKHPSISSVWPKNLDKKTTMITGPKSVLIAWNSAAFDRENKVLYFWGGGHADYGGNEMYRFELSTGNWRRLTNPSPLNHLYVASGYNSKPDKPWRRLCWVTDANSVPGSAHTYDGFIFSHTTKTIFLYVTIAANGACFNDKNDTYKDSLLVIGSRLITRGWYEFNPSPEKSLNGLAPLNWRKVFDSEQLQKAAVHKGYPVSAELKNGAILFGSKYRTVNFNPTKPTPDSLKFFSHQADWGDGTKYYDRKNNIIWSLHHKMLLGFDVNNGRTIRKIKANIDHGKSLATNNKSRIVSWNGYSRIYSLDPNRKDPVWEKIDWGKQGPRSGDKRVYGKWVYLQKEDVFVGLSSHKTGVWVYKHPN